MFIDGKKPVVGLFLDEPVVQLLKSQMPVQLQRPALYADAARAAGVKLILFSPGDISLNPERIYGISYNYQRGQWAREVSPLPDILYDRYLGNTPAQKKRADDIRRQLKKRGVKKLNSRHTFDKQELFQALSQFPQISDHLPLTREYISSDDLEKMFQQTNCLYLKAADGRRGKQVLSIMKLKNGSYAYRYYNDRLFSGKTANLHALKRVIHTVTGGKKAIIQQAVPLLRFNNRLIDLRGEMQRNGAGRIEIVAVLTRVGQDGSPITTHGSSFLFEDFFKNYLNYNLKSVAALSAKINQFLYAVYSCVEQSFGPFGEIAVDFGLDNSCGIWLLECNARSMKVSLMNAAGGNTVRQAFLNPMLYARYLCRQDQEK